MIERLASSWDTLGVVVLGTAGIYVVVLAGARVAGRRTMSQLSAFDAVVTVALGSTMATTALNAKASVADGSAVIATLLALQLLLAAGRRRSSRLRRILDFSPEPVARDGEPTLPTSLLSSQLSTDELRSLLRQKGVFGLDDVQLVLLEPSGGISVVTDPEVAARLHRVPELGT